MYTCSILQNTQCGTKKEQMASTSVGKLLHVHNSMHCMCTCSTHESQYSAVIRLHAHVLIIYACTCTITCTCTVYTYIYHQNNVEARSLTIYTCTCMQQIKSTMLLAKGHVHNIIPCTYNTTISGHPTAADEAWH